MTPSRIRPLAICLFRHADKILVAEYYDPAKAEKFFRPIGGGIEFGELAAETIAREVREELGVRVRDVRYLFTLENIFVFNNTRGHEIVLVHDGMFADTTLYTRDYLDGNDSESTFRAVWKTVDELQHDARPLYPPGILEKLSSQ